MEEIEKLVNTYNEKIYEDSRYPLITIIKEYPDYQEYFFSTDEIRDRNSYVMIMDQEMAKIKHKLKYKLKYHKLMIKKLQKDIVFLKTHVKKLSIGAKIVDEVEDFPRLVARIGFADSRTNEINSEELLENSSISSEEEIEEEEEEEIEEEIEEEEEEEESQNIDYEIVHGEGGLSAVVYPIPDYTSDSDLDSEVTPQSNVIVHSFNHKSFVFLIIYEFINLVGRFLQHI